MVKSIKGELGRIDVLVNNAGTVKDQILPFAKAEDFGELIAVNLRPTFLLSKLAARMMIKNKWGRIINITSVVGHSGNFGQSLYAATKSAITGFTLSIAQDLAQFNILCNCVAPGLIDSEMTARLSDEIIAAIKERIPLKKIWQATGCRTGGWLFSPPPPRNTSLARRCTLTEGCLQANDC